MAADSIAARVAAYNELYSDPTASAAYLLCDRHDPEGLAFRFVGPDLTSQIMSFGDLAHRSQRMAGGLAGLGIGPGDRVATLMSKGPELLVSLVAILRLGAVHVPLFTAFAPPAIAFRLHASGARAVICDTGQDPKIAALQDAPEAGWRVIRLGPGRAVAVDYHELLAGGPDEFPAAAMGGGAPIVQIYTSGTTGDPKGVNVPLRALASFHAYLEYGLDARSDDVFWNAADPGWAYGLYYGVLAPLAAGLGGLMLTGSSAAETIHAVLETFQVTNFAAAPTVYRTLRAYDAPLSKPLRCASSAGEPLTPDVNSWASSALGVEVRDHYGQTETGMTINNHQHPDLRQAMTQASMGQSMPGWRACILKSGCDEPAETNEVGRVAVDLAASPLAWFQGYVGDRTKTAEKFSSDGRWYLTGDMGRVDEQGRFYFSSRDDDVIIMAGYRIGPTEVEAVLVSHPAVAECAVVAAPDDLRGELLVAFVVAQPRATVSEHLTAGLQAWVKQLYAAHAYPRQVHYVRELPRTPSGKVKRYVLRQQLRSGSACGRAVNDGR